MARPAGGGFDAIYASKVFDFTPDYPYFPTDCDVFRGGTGYDVSSRLPEEAERAFPDYSIYPDAQYSIGRFTRGCPNRCPWCVVWRQDGNEVREVARLSDFHDPRFSVVRALDDNIMACPDALAHACEQMREAHVRVIWEALDIRLVTDETARLLASVPTKGCLHFAWDGPSQDDAIARGIETLGRAGIRPYRLMFYVLVGAGTSREYDMRRIRTLWDEHHVWPFVMPFDKGDQYQRDLARWCNNRFVFKKCNRFEDYDCRTNREGL